MTAPYARGLAAENARRGHDAPEYELADTGIFDEDPRGSSSVRAVALAVVALPE